MNGDARAALRECGCPEWVERCVHFDGRVLAMTSGVLIRTEHRRHMGGERWATSYWWYFQDSSTMACPVCGEQVWSKGTRCLGITEDFDAALVAFHAAEADLLAQ